MMRSLVAAAMAGAVMISFADTVQSPFRDAIDHLTQSGVVQGYADGTFRPDQPINRAEFLTLLLRAAPQTTAASSSASRCFTDFRGTAQWYWQAACQSKAVGILTGYPDGTFRADLQVTLAEALAMAERAWNVRQPAYFRMPDHWYDTYFDALSATSITLPFGRQPALTLTRADAAEVLWQFVMEFGQGSSSSAPYPQAMSVCGNGKLEPGEQCDDGNLINGDGCSMLCLSTLEPIRHAFLQIEQETLADQAVVAGQKNTPLMQFRAAAGSQGVDVHRLVFRSASGTLNSATNYRMHVQQSDGSWALSAERGKVSGEVLTFSNANIPVGSGTEVEMMLTADIVLQPPSNVLSVAWNTADADYVAGVGQADQDDVTGITTDGSQCPYTYALCWVSVATQAPSVLHITGSGSLFINPSPGF